VYNKAACRYERSLCVVFILEQSGALCMDYGWHLIPVLSNAIEMIIYIKVMLLYDAIQSYEDSFSISIYTGFSMICLSHWGENETGLYMLDERCTTPLNIHNYMTYRIWNNTVHYALIMGGTLYPYYQMQLK
jgi:hypothetical protein